MNKGVLLVLATAVISGFSIFLNAYGVAGLDPYAFTGAKNLIVALLLISVIALATRLSELKTLTRRQWGRLALIGLVGGSLPFLLFFKGLSMGSGATGAFIHKTMVAWVALGALLYLKEKVDWRVIAGALALLVGNYLVLGLAGVSIGAGAWLILAATLLWSVEILLAKKLLKDVSGSTVAFGRMGFGAGIITLYLLVSGHASAVMAWNAAAWGWIAVTSVVLLGYVWTFYNGLQKVRASTAVAILSLGSVITTTLQLAFAGASIGAGQVAGMLLLVMGAGAFWWLQKETVRQPTSSTA